MQRLRHGPAQPRGHSGSKAPGGGGNQRCPRRPDPAGCAVSLSEMEPGRGSGRAGTGPRSGCEGLTLSATWTGHSEGGSSHRLDNAGTQPPPPPHVKGVCCWLRGGVRARSRATHVATRTLSCSPEMGRETSWPDSTPLIRALSTARDTSSDKALLSR